ncbi:uncharacterized protein LOC135473205 [Liolophura sinensis]|uniref:uncharacterized protein LOC135473205 n=1 Tax=Liolophura sinensis TaxID=3198878 RepID=UPI0031581F9B
MGMRVRCKWPCSHCEVPWYSGKCPLLCLDNSGNPITEDQRQASSSLGLPGLGEVCSHVAALLMKMEMGVKLGLTKQSSVSQACKWNRSFRKELHPMTISDLQDKIKGRRSKRIMSVIASGKDNLPPVSDLLALNDVFPDAVFFSTIPRLDPEDTDSASERDEGYCDTLQPLRSLHEMCKGMEITEESLETIWSAYNSSKQKVMDLHEKTKGQAECNLWFEHRKGRITGTKAHSVFTIRDITTPKNLVWRIT